MQVDGARSKLFAAFETIQHHWDEVREKWHDNVRDEFERTIMEPLIHGGGDALRAIDLLGQLFARIRHDCEHRQ